LDKFILLNIFYWERLYVLNLKKYYEKYWDRDSDVSNSDVTTPERKRRLLETLTQHLNSGDNWI